ncbi:MAG: hypothetical protein AAAB16_11955 [Pseudomonas sp.]|uniref:hypothetical protein n=1 Tax=Pseudomonas sp. TaxID=306 RepID=UPI0030F25242
MPTPCKATLALFCAMSAMSAHARPFAEVDCTHAAEPISENKLTFKNSKERLKALSYTATVYSYGKDGRQEEQIAQVPRIALKMGDDWLAGSNRGEWGGELMLIDAKGNAQKIISDNIRDMYPTEFGIVVVAGLSHMMSNRGKVYLITKNGASLDTKVLFGLDGAPKDSWTTAEGKIFITTSYGTSIIKKDFTLQRVLCKGHQYSDYRQGL